MSVRIQFNEKEWLSVFEILSNSYSDGADGLSLSEEELDKLVKKLKEANNRT